jgi:CHASE3 domain sensor protein
MLLIKSLLLLLILFCVCVLLIVISYYLYQDITLRKKDLNKQISELVESNYQLRLKLSHYEQNN